jgi:hypothetical protein
MPARAREEGSVHHMVSMTPNAGKGVATKERKKATPTVMEYWEPITSSSVRAPALRHPFRGTPQFLHSSPGSPDPSLAVGPVLRTRQSIFRVVLLDPLHTGYQCVGEYGVLRTGGNWGTLVLLELSVTFPPPSLIASVHFLGIAVSIIPGCLANKKVLLKPFTRG